MKAKIVKEIQITFTEQEALALSRINGKMNSVDVKKFFGGDPGSIAAEEADQVHTDFYCLLKDYCDKTT